MSVGTAPAGDKGDLAGRLRRALPAMWREIGAGLTLACVALPFCVSAGVLVFQPLGADFLGIGAAAGLVCAVVAGLVGALCRSPSFLTTAPTTAMALLQASLCASVLASTGDPRLVLIALPLCALLTGLFQIAIGATGLAGVMKFTPYPVLAGFVSGLGLLVLAQQVKSLFGVASLADLGVALATVELPHVAMPVFGALIVAAILVLNARAPRLPSLLAGLLVGLAAYHLARLAMPTLDLGPTIGPLPSTGLWTPPPLDVALLDTLAANVDVVQATVLSAATLAVLATLDVSFAARMVQNVSDIMVSTRRDLIGQGAANLATAFSGGLAVSTSATLTMANHRAGGRTPLAGVTAALALLLGIVLAPNLIAGLPVAVLAAILTAISFRLFDPWCFRIVREAFSGEEPDARVRAARNAAIAFVVLVTTVLGQPVLGAAVGVALSCLVFITDMSQPVVRRLLGGDAVFSKRIRSRADMEILREVGRRTVVIELQGVLFFGNADRLASEIRALEGKADVVILDLRRVSDVDASGATVLQQTARRCGERRIHVLAAGSAARSATLIRGALAADGGAMVSDLDAALEWAEERTLRLHAPDGARAHALNLAETDLARGMTQEEIAVFADHLQEEAYPPGSLLCQAGDAADRLWILTRGIVSIRVSGARADRRLATLGPGTSVGEMGLLDRTPRSANVCADQAVEAHVLTADRFEALLADHPRVGQAVLMNIARQTAQRLRNTSDDLRLSES